MNGILADVNELHADANSGKGITDFAARLHFEPGKREAKTQVQHRAFGILAAGIDEHSGGADVRDARDDAFVRAFVLHGDLADAMDAQSCPRGVPVFFYSFERHSFTAPSGTSARRLPFTDLTSFRFFPQCGQNKKAEESSRAHETQEMVLTGANGTTRCTSSRVVRPSRTCSRAYSCMSFMPLWRASVRFSSLLPPSRMAARMGSSTASIS